MTADEFPVQVTAAQLLALREAGPGYGIVRSGDGLVGLMWVTDGNVPMVRHEEVAVAGFGRPAAERLAAALNGA